MSNSDSATLAELVAAESVAGQTVGINFCCSLAKEMVLKIPSMPQGPGSVLGSIKDISKRY